VGKAGRFAVAADADDIEAELARGAGHGAAHLAAADHHQRLADHGVAKIGSKLPARWRVYMAGMWLLSMRMAMAPYSPDLGAWTPRLLVRVTPRGSQSSGSICSMLAPMM
jgi:hypothetical protein